MKNEKMTNQSYCSLNKRDYEMLWLQKSLFSAFCETSSQTSSCSTLNVHVCGSVFYEYKAPLNKKPKHRLLVQRSMLFLIKHYSSFVIASETA